MPLAALLNVATHDEEYALLQERTSIHIRAGRFIIIVYAQSIEWIHFHFE